MKLAEFNKKFPEDIEGYTMGALRINDISKEVVGFVLKNPEGVKRFILRFGDDAYIEPYW